MTPEQFDANQKQEAIEAFKDAVERLDMVSDQLTDADCDKLIQFSFRASQIIDKEYST